MTRHLVTAVGCIALAALAIGLAKLFQARFARGDTYPAYSTYRADPKGTRALFAVYSELSEKPVLRNVTPPALLKPEAIGDATFVRLGLRSFQLPQAEAAKLGELATAGARVVVARDTLNYLPSDFETTELSSAPPTGGEGDAPEPPGTTTDLREAWGFTVSYQELDEDFASLREMRPAGGWRATGSGDPPARWWTPARLTDLDEEWQVFASVEGRPVGIERPWGAGSLVVLTGSYFASNESLSLEPPTPFLQHVFGETGSRPIVFDETQLGTTVAPNIVGLIFRYRLAGTLAGIACVLALYIWKNSSPLVKPDADSEARRYADASIRGLDAATGLVRLVRRHVPQAALLPTAFRTWRNANARRRIPLPPEALAEAESLVAAHEALPPRDRDLVGTYNQLVTLLNPSRR